MRAKTDYGLETLVRMLYLEPAVRGRRALVLGRDPEAMAGVLTRMGAAEARTHLHGEARSLPWDLAGLRGKRDADKGKTLPVRKGEVDLVLIPDLGEIDDYRVVLGEASRALAEGGLLVVSARNAECTVPISETGLESVPEVWSVDSLSELLAQYFAHVEIVGQSPFLGYALASYDPVRGREGVRLDTSLMRDGGEDPEFVVALCGHRSPASPLTNALFQMPMAEMALVEGRAPDREPGESDTEREIRAEAESLRRELGNRNVIVSRLEKELERVEGEAEQARQKMLDTRTRMERERREVQAEALESAMRKEAGKVPETWLTERAALVRELEDERRGRARAEEENRKLHASLDEADRGGGAGGAPEDEARVKDLEGRLERSEARARDLQARLERAEAKGNDLRTKLKQAEARLREEESRSPEMGRRIGELEASLDATERELGRARADLAAAREEAAALRAARPPEPPPEPAPSSPAEGEELARLRQELARREDLIRDLIRELEVLPSVMEERGGQDEEVHRLVGEMERMRGESEDLARRASSLAAEVAEARARAEAAERELAEASAVLDMAGDALESRAATPAGREEGAAPADTATAAASRRVGWDRVMVEIQESLRRIAGDPRGAAVSRELGQLWVEIERSRRTR